MHWILSMDCSRMIHSGGFDIQYTHKHRFTHINNRTFYDQVQHSPRCDRSAICTIHLLSECTGMCFLMNICLFYGSRNQVLRFWISPYPTRTHYTLFIIITRMFGGNQIPYVFLLQTPAIIFNTHKHFSAYLSVQQPLRWIQFELSSHQEDKFLWTIFEVNFHSE